MAPIVHDQAGALSEHGVAVAIPADEVRYAPLVVLVDYLDLFIGALGHGFEAGIGLPSLNIFRVRHNYGLRKLIHRDIVSQRNAVAGLESFFFLTPVCVSAVYGAVAVGRDKLTANPLRFTCLLYILI